MGFEKIHHIENTHEFYKALGYTDEIMESGLLPEEFIWYEYHKDNSEKSEACLQAKIIEYLLKHSEKFKKESANEVQHWFGSCVDKKFGKLTECIDCIMHPKRMRN